VVCLYAIGGLTVGICIRYADNISKDFATSAAILLATFGSVYFLDFQINIYFIIGAFFVIISIFLYSSAGHYLHIYKKISNMILSI